MRVDQPTITGELGPARTHTPLFARDDCRFVETVGRNAFDKGGPFFLCQQAGGGLGAAKPRVVRAGSLRTQSARHWVDHGTICGRNCANSGHYKPLGACVHRIFVNPNSSPRRSEKFGTARSRGLHTRRASCAFSCPHSPASRSSAARPYCRPRIKGVVCHDPELDQRFLS